VSENAAEGPPIGLVGASRQSRRPPADRRGGQPVFAPSVCHTGVASRPTPPTLSQIARKTQLEAEVLPRMELDSGGGTAAFHGCRSGTGSERRRRATACRPSRNYRTRPWAPPLPGKAARRCCLRSCASWGEEDMGEGRRAVAQLAEDRGADEAPKPVSRDLAKEITQPPAIKPKVHQPCGDIDEV
jgi:hypothetical protein